MNKLLISTLVVGFLATGLQAKVFAQQKRAYCNYFKQTEWIDLGLTGTVGNILKKDETEGKTHDLQTSSSLRRVYDRSNFSCDFTKNVELIPALFSIQKQGIEKEEIEMTENAKVEALLKLLLHQMKAAEMESRYQN